MRHGEKEFKKTLMIELELFREFAKANKFISLNENSTDRDRERFIYREGKLKKFVSSILFLNRDIKSNKKTGKSNKYNKETRLINLSCL